MEYTIGEFSELTGIGIHTLRYYEKEALIVPNRKVNGRRCYTDSDIKWIEFIKRLKETNMSIKEIQRYAKLRAQGDDTLELRMEMLIQHRATLLSEISAMQEHLSKLDNKVQYYEMEITKKKTIM
ncbi:MAG: MerR family transcriptional regulator [Lachnospiraceae bacterium]